MLFFLVETVVGLLALAFLVYAILETRSVKKGALAAKCAVPFQNMDAMAQHADRDTLPPVTVLLPVCNEKLVIRKLLQSVCALDYPGDRLEILALDDSTDETHALVEGMLPRFLQEGINIRHLRREKRTGYKAGNLTFGLSKAKGEFIAIFDADCLPPSDFLLRAMPCFDDEKVGFLQTGIRYVNENASFLTRFQAMEAGHKESVTSGLSLEGLMASLTGSSCVWRRACIDAIGGISSATITEDVDMGYKAQLMSWKYVWLGNVTSRAEFPETMAAFRVQRQRWARGLIQNALRHVREMFQASMPLLGRLYALSLMFSSLLLASFYLVLLLCLPVVYMTPSFGPTFHLVCAIFLAAACVWAWANTKNSTNRESTARKKAASIGMALGYVFMHFPISLYYFTAALQVFLRRESGFHRTPKGAGRKRLSSPRINKILVRLEVFSLVYAALALGLSLAHGLYWVSFYTFLCLVGFSMSLFFSFSDSRKVCIPSHIVITGATGSLGSALAYEYAAPGRHLILTGRRNDVLAKVAQTCRDRGAMVEAHVLNLEDTDAVRLWMKGVCEQNIPDLVIANAGRNTDIGPNLEGEDFREARALVQVNLLSGMALFDATLPFFRKQGGGQFAFISSLAGYYGLAMTPTYCATKAALKSYGTSLRAWLLKENIHVNVIFPGYVRSPMCEAMPGPKPFLMEPAKAARRIRKGLERDFARISFPFPLNLGVWGLGLLPLCLAMPIAKILGYGPIGSAQSVPSTKTAKSEQA